MNSEERKLFKKLSLSSELEEDFSVIEWIGDNICDTVEECKDKLSYYYENNNRFGFDLALLKHDFYFFEDREISIKSIIGDLHRILNHQKPIDRDLKKLNGFNSKYNLLNRLYRKSMIKGDKLYKNLTSLKILYRHNGYKLDMIEWDEVPNRVLIIESDVSFFNNKREELEEIIKEME